MTPDLQVSLGEVIMLGSVLVGGGVIVGQMRSIANAFKEHVRDAGAEFRRAAQARGEIHGALAQVRESVARLEGTRSGE